MDQMDEELARTSIAESFEKVNVLLCTSILQLASIMNKQTHSKLKVKPFYKISGVVDNE